jgi:hypothetical protein
MQPQAEEPELLKNYLLGNVPEDVQERIEVRLLHDPEYGEAVAEAQNELLDDYAAGALTAAESARFREHFLTTPERVERLQFARALNRYAGPGAQTARGARPQPAAPAPRPRRDFRLKFLLPLAAALVLAAGLVVWKAAPGWLSPGQTDPATRRQKVEQEVARLNAWQDGGGDVPEAAPSTPVLTLEPLLLRGPGGARRVTVGGGTEAVQLRLELLADDHPSYRVTLQNLDGEEIFTRAGLRSRALDGGRLLVIHVPASALPPGSYLLRVGAGDAGGPTTADVGSYSFEVGGRK